MFLASVIATIEQRRPRLANILIICDFTDVFPDEVLGLPTAREVEFTIDLVPDMTLISRAPYCMTPLELRELKA